MKYLLAILLMMPLIASAMEWEVCENNFIDGSVERSKVPHGWILRGFREMTYYPDEKHEWKCKDES